MTQAGAPERDPTQFIAHHTILATSPLVPEIRLHLATELTPLWLASEAFLETNGIDPPYWAFAWPGSQLLARYILDHPNIVRGRRVLDFACGNGLAGIAAIQAGASHVSANDIDPMALQAATMNASSNHVTLHIIPGNLVNTLPTCDIILAGDICYNASMAATLLPWLRECAKSCDVYLADPGRRYAPVDNVTHVLHDEVPTSLELENRQSLRTTIVKLKPLSG